LVRQIFISHSQEDELIIEFFLGTFGLAGPITPILYEYKTKTEPDWQEIQRDIQSPLTCALFVLLGPRILFDEYNRRKQHTPNWITWETGIARQAGKDIWVFEDYNTPVDFPIPSFDHYMRYNIGSKDHRVYIANRINDYRILLRVRQIRKLTEAAILLTCPCGISFYYHNAEKSLICPKCKEYMEFP